jgi:hypothetical protein
VHTSAAFFSGEEFMKLTVAYRDKPKGGFSGAKYHFVAFHVDFSNEERAIIQQQGLHDLYIMVPTDSLPPSKGGDFLAFFMRIVGIVLIPIGGLLALVAHLKPSQSDMSGPGWIMLIVGAILFTIGKIKDVSANKREAQPEQKLTLRRLSTNPDFAVFAYSLQEAQGHEENVRELLAGAAKTIRNSSSVPSQTSYEL